MTTTYGAEIDLADAASHCSARQPVWAGSSLHGFPLDSVRSLSLPTTDGAVPGLSIAYGSAEGGGPHVELSESATAAEGLTMLVGVRGYVPPEGTALVAGSQALVGMNGLVVAIHAPDEEMAIDVARLLEPHTG